MPCPLIESLPGTKFALTHKGIKPGPGINTPITCSVPLSLFKVGNWVLSGELGSTLVVLSEVHHCWHTYPSFCPYSLSLLYLGPTIDSGLHMPSTCPYGLELVKHRDCHSSLLFLGKSMSHSLRVNSNEAEQVVRLTLAYSF